MSMNTNEMYLELRAAREAYNAAHERLLKVIEEIETEIAPRPDVVESLEEREKLLNTEVTREECLSTRAYNVLRLGYIYTFGDLIKYRRMDMIKFRNMGKKTLRELDELLERHGLSWSSKSNFR